ncbi:ABC transporter ATP-binding protein [Nocardiopsis sp. CT-R113]|uniref:ABC transporter ATP-binding protein n=1 Tax=Nocardiopsis codii TaxID=3065942 RepID=A0ABU7KCH8_9ACTN|nr:ABC transporter ATP-binding protein [Nocardiopsis sp. CT-R113]MEE2039949.1 ABC transporter ATP-binding protein [Nocardiopsis sp. CT-R113]
MIRSFLRALGPERSGPVRASLALTALVSAVQGVVFALLVPVLAALLGPTPSAAVPWTLLLLSVTALYALLRAAGLFLNFRVGGSISRALHHRLGDHVVRLPLGWFTGARVGELSRVATDGVSRATNVPVHIYPPLVDAVVTPLVAVLALSLWDWRVALACAACAPVLWAVFSLAGRAVGRNDAARDAVTDEAAGRVLEYARAQTVLRAFGGVERGHARLDAALAAEHAASRRLLLRAVPALLGYSFAVRLSFGLVLVYAVLLALGGTLDAPLAVALLVLVARFVQPLAGAADQGAALRMAGNGLGRINAVLDARPLPEPETPVPPRGAEVEFDGVRFGYTDDGPPVLDGVSFRAEPGTLTALVGPSGSGKTTVARLLARFHDADVGSVRIGGVDVRSIGSEVLAEHVSVVFQDVYLFDASIADNVRLADPGAAQEDLDRVAAASGLDSVLAALPDGWDTRVGEGGTALSGGQKQRVSIARALLKDAPVIVLDEASAALDAENEALVTATARTLSRDRTVLVIAHRPATVAAADRVVFLDGGRVAEQGRPGELLAHGGRHAEFVRARERAEGWRLSAEPA